MKIYDYINITAQEIPWLLHTSFMVAGCPMNCVNCSWKEIEKTQTPYELSEDLYLEILEKNLSLTEGVVFLGGEWYKDDLIKFLQIAQSYKLTTCLYTGLDDVSDDIKKHLNYLKTGHYDETFGPLSSPTTNQRFVDLETGECMNDRFQKKVTVNNNG